LFAQFEASKSEKVGHRSLWVGQSAFWHSVEQYRALLHRTQTRPLDLLQEVHKPNALESVMMIGRMVSEVWMRSFEEMEEK